MSSMKDIVASFKDHFFFSNGVSVQLVEGGAVSIEKYEDHAMYFTKEQFNAGLHFLLPSLFKQPPLHKKSFSSSSPQRG